MDESKKTIGPHPNPKNCLVGPKKAKNDPSNAKSKILRKKSYKLKVTSLYE